jgi:hypothetical protein
MELDWKRPGHGRSAGRRRPACRPGGFEGEARCAGSETRPGGSCPLSRTSSVRALSWVHRLTILRCARPPTCCPPDSDTGARPWQPWRGPWPGLLRSISCPPFFYPPWCPASPVREQPGPRAAFLMHVSFLWAFSQGCPSPRTKQKRGRRHRIHLPGKSIARCRHDQDREERDRHDRTCQSRRGKIGASHVHGPVSAPFCTR